MRISALAAGWMLFFALMAGGMLVCSMAPVEAQAQEQAQLQAQAGGFADTSAYQPFEIVETTDGVVDEAVTATKLTLLGSNATVVGYEQSQGCGYLLVKENNKRDGYYHLYLVGSQGVAKEFQNTDESVIDGITIQRCWRGGTRYFDDTAGNDALHTNHNDIVHSIYAVKTPSGAYDIFDADTGGYFEHQLDEQPSPVFGGTGYESEFDKAGLAIIKKNGLVGLMKPDGSLLYAPKFTRLDGLDRNATVGTISEDEYAVVTPNGCGVSKDGTKITTWYQADIVSDNYAEVTAKAADAYATSLVRLSDGKVIPLEHNMYVTHANDSSVICYRKEYVEDSGYGYGADYKYYGKIFNDRYPNGYDLNAVYGGKDEFNVYLSATGGFLVEWVDYDEMNSDESGAVYHVDCYDERMNKLGTASDYAQDWESYDVPVGEYGQIKFFVTWNIDLEATFRLLSDVKCVGPSGTIGIFADVLLCDGLLAAQDESGTWCTIDPETGAKKFAFYGPSSSSADVYANTFMQYWLDADYDSDSDKFGLISVKTNTNTGAKFTFLGRAYSDEDANFAMVEVYDGTKDEDGDSVPQWVDGNLDRIASLNGVYGEDVLVDALTKTIMVKTDQGVFASGDDYSYVYDIYSYASGTVQKVTSCIVKNESDYGDMSMIPCLYGDNALVVSEQADEYDYRHGLISRDGNLLIKPDAYNYATAPGRNLYAFATAKYVGYDDEDYCRINDLNVDLYDYTGKELVKNVTLNRVKETESFFAGDLTAVYRTPDDSNSYYFYDLTDAVRATNSAHVRVTEEMLYTTADYSDLLENPAFNKLTLSMQSKLLDQEIKSSSNAKYAWSYVKTMTKKWTKALEIAWKDAVFRDMQQESGFNASETELYEELAQQLLEGVMETDEWVIDDVKDALDTVEGYVKDYKRVKKIVKYADTDPATIRQYSEFLEKVMTPSWAKPNRDRRYEFYQSLQTESFWKKLGNVETVLGDTCDVLDMVTSYACICRLDAELAHILSLYVPADSGLYTGLKSLETKILYPTSSMVCDFVQDQLDGALVDMISEGGVEELMQMVTGASSSAIGGYTAIASLMYYALSESIGSATLSDRLKAHCACMNASAMEQALRTYRTRIIDQNDLGKSVNFQEARKRYMLLFWAYDVSVEQAVEALDSVVQADGETPANCDYHGFYDANAGALTYGSYIRSCLAGGEAVWQGEVRNGKVFITKYVPGTTAEDAGDDYLLSVPSSLVVDGQSYPVGGIASGAFDGVEVGGVCLPDTLTDIESGAFAGAAGLTAVYVPATLETIATDAFGDDASGVLVTGQDSDALKDFADANTGADVQLGDKLLAAGGLAAVAGITTIPVSFDEETGTHEADGLELQVTYEDGSTETITEGFVVEPKDAETVIISYGGESIELPVASGSMVARPITVHFVDAAVPDVDLATPTIVYVAYGATSFTLPHAPDVYGYRLNPVPVKRPVSDDDTSTNYTYTRVLLGDGDLVYDPVVKVEEDAVIGEEGLTPGFSVNAPDSWAFLDDPKYTVEYQFNKPDDDGRVGLYDEEADRYYLYAIVTFADDCDWMGTAVAKFEVDQGIRLADENVKVPAEARAEDGMEPPVSVAVDGVSLTEGVDYTVTYRDNTVDENGQLGAYDESDSEYYVTAVVKGMGAYTGTVTARIRLYWPDSVASGDISVSLSKATFTYNGKVQKPTVKSVSIRRGHVLGKGDYTVTYLSNSSSNVGTYKVRVTLKDHYEGTTTANYTVIPPTTTISKLSRGKAKLTVKWKKQTAQTTGYQLRYSLKKNFKSGVKTLTVKKAKKTSATLKKLKRKKTYYVQLRTYKKVGSVTYYSAWSNVKKAKVK